MYIFVDDKLFFHEIQLLLKIKTHDEQIYQIIVIDFYVTLYDMNIFVNHHQLHNGASFDSFLGLS